MPARAPTLRYAALNAAYWAGFCLVMAFSSVFLLARGLTNAQIGVVLAASGFVSAVLQPVVADRAGRSRLPLRTWVALLAALTALAASGLVVPAATPLTDALLFGALLCLVQLVAPLVNALGMDTARSGVPVDYGRARAVGSLAFALTSTVVGALVAATDATAIPPLVIAAQALLVVAAVTFVFTTPGTPSDAAPRVAAPRHPLPDAAPPPTPTGRRRFAWLLVGLTGAFVSHAAINSFLFQVVAHHGGTASHMGLAFTIAASVEMLPMLLFSRIVARWHSGTLLRVAAIAFAVKALATLLAPGLTPLLLTMVLQMAAFGLVIPASVYYVDRMLPARERTRGQAMMTLTLTVGNVVAGLGGGVLLDVAGVPALLAAGTLAAALGVLGVVAGTRSDRPL